MRKAFVETLCELAGKDERILLLTGDLGFNCIEPFVRDFPGRYFNTGVAEQNMLGLAVGLAEAGFIPFVYSIANFASMRPYEFIRNGAVLHRMPVRVVGTGGGFDYGTAGPTHYGLEDIGILRIQKDLTVVVPSDNGQVKTALRETWDVPGPVYYRISKESFEALEGLDARFHLGRACKLKNGRDCVLVVMGVMAREADAAARILAEKGVDAGLAVVSSFNPSPEEDLADILRASPLAVTVEDHYAVGGLHSFACETAARRGISCRIFPCAVKNSHGGAVGSRAFMNDLHGLSAEKIARTVIAQLRRP